MSLRAIRRASRAFDNLCNFDAVQPALVGACRIFAIVSHTASLRSFSENRATPSVVTGRHDELIELQSSDYNHFVDRSVNPSFVLLKGLCVRTRMCHRHDPNDALSRINGTPHARLIKPCHPRPPPITSTTPRDKPPFIADSNRANRPPTDRPNTKRFVSHFCVVVLLCSLRRIVITHGRSNLAARARAAVLIQSTTDLPSSKFVTASFAALDRLTPFRKPPRCPRK